MNKPVRAALYEQAKSWVLEAGELIREQINDPMVIEKKSNEHDLVTETDKMVEKYFADRIKATYPDHLMLGEEGYGDDVTSLDGTVWIIDPIDGTMNFVHLRKDFAISIGIFHDGVGEIAFVYDVMADELYSACRGEGAFKNNAQLKQLNEEQTLNDAIFAFNHDLLCENQKFDRSIIEKLLNDIRSARIIGAASLDIVNVAEGLLDGYISNGLSPWDVAGGYIILNEVGGITSRNDGKAINMLEEGAVVACNQSIHQRVINDYLKYWHK